MVIATSQGGPPTGIVWGCVAVILFFLLIMLLKALIRVCSANAILVIAGRKSRAGGKEYGYTITPAGWTYAIPFWHRVEALDLTIVPIDVRVEGVNSANGITLGADATACVCIDDSDASLLYSAVERLLGKSRREIQEQIQKTMIGNFRGALNRTTPLQAIGMEEDIEREQTESGVKVSDVAAKGGETVQFRDLLLKDCTEDLSTFGLKVVSVSLQRIWDTSQYIANLANKTLANKRKEVEIEEARLRAGAERTESDGERRIEVAKNQADQSIVAAVQDLEVLRQKCEAAIQKVSLETDSAVAGATSEGQKRVQQESIALQELKNRSDVVLRIEAERQKAEIIARGSAEATEIIEGTRNELLERRVRLLTEAGDYGKIALFITQLPNLFRSFQRHGKNLAVDRVLVMSEENGFDEAVNRGPRALVDFLRQFEEAFGVSVRNMLSSGGAATGDAPGDSEEEEGKEVSQ